MPKQSCQAGKKWTQTKTNTWNTVATIKNLNISQMPQTKITFFFVFIPSVRISALVCSRDPQTQSCKQSCAPASPANGGQGEVTLNRSLLWLGSSPSVASVETSIIPAGEVIDYKTEGTKTIEVNWITSMLEVKQCGRTKLAEDHWTDPPFS